MTTKDIIEKFDEKSQEVDTWMNQDGTTYQTVGMSINKTRTFIQSSLTELLDSIEKETLGKIPFTMKRSRKEVINIINSHR